VKKLNNTTLFILLVSYLREI